MAEKLNQKTFIAGPDGENLHEVDPYVCDGVGTAKEIA